MMIRIKTAVIALAALVALSTGHSQVPVLGSTGLFTKQINNVFFVGSGGYSTIQGAISAAGSTGAVTILPQYLGTDSWSNPSAIKITDLRLPNNQQTGIPVIHAEDFGAKCSGLVDDTPAIQAALNLQYAYNYTIATTTQMVVQMPQGSCLITSPLLMGAHGSLIGQGDGTFLIAKYDAWTGTDYSAIEIVFNGRFAGGASVGARRIADFNLVGEFNSSVPTSTGILIKNNANVYAPQDYAFSGFSFNTLQISQFDTGIQAEDLINSEITNVVINSVRQGILFFGDVENVALSHLSIYEGSWDVTSTHSATAGLSIQPNTKYGVACGVTQYCAPQAITLSDSQILNFNYNINVGQCIKCDIHNNSLDQAGAAAFGGGTAGGAAILMGVNAVSGGFWITDNYIGVLDPSSSYDIYSTATTVGANNGLWITGNTFLLDDLQTSVSALGIALNGTSTISSVHILDNEFYGLTSAIVIGQNLTNSRIVGNTGSGIRMNFINLSNSPSLIHNGTLIDQNYDSDDSIPIVVPGTATGFRLGFNYSGTYSLPFQTTGTLDAIGNGCTITAGAIGNNCTATISFSPPFADGSFAIVGCTVQSATGNVFVGSTASVTQSTFTVQETAADTSSTGGGTIYCQVNHQ